MIFSVAGGGVTDRVVSAPQPTWLIGLGRSAPGKCEAAPGQKQNIPHHVQRNLQYMAPLGSMI